MKSLKCLTVLLLCLTMAAYSQEQKTKVFSQFPDIIECSAQQFSNAFSAKEGESISITFSDNFSITGKVISNVQKYDNLYSMTISVPAYANAVFQLSKQINTDRSHAFVGRILSTESADGFEIKRDEAGNYKLYKTEKDLRQICSQ